MPVRTANIPNNIIFTGGTVVSGSDQIPHANWAVAVSGGLVTGVGPADSIVHGNPGARVIDVTGATVLPGLTDAHGHLYGWILDPKTGRATEAPLDDLATEFPAINDARTGLDHRYIYSTTTPLMLAVSSMRMPSRSSTGTCLPGHTPSRSRP